MARLARDGSKVPKLVKLAQSLTRWNNRDATIGAIEGYVRSRFRYTGEDVETLRTVEKMLEDLDRTGRLFGDCDDICIFLASLFLASGLHPRFVAIRTDPAMPDYLHVFLTVAEYRVDVTVSPHTVLNFYGQPMEWAV